MRVERGPKQPRPRARRPGRLGIAAMALWLLGTACETPRSDVPWTDADTADDAEFVDAVFAVQSACETALQSSEWATEMTATILDAVRLDLEPPYDERAWFAITLGPDGLVDRFELSRVSSTSIEAAFAELVELPPRFPRADADMRLCLGTETFPLVVAVFQRFECRAQPEYAAFHDHVHTRIYEQLYAARLSRRPGHGWIRADLRIGPDGRVEGIDYPARTDHTLRRKFESAVAAVASFDAPPDYLRCFVDRPLGVRVEVQGSEGAE